MTNSIFLVQNMVMGLLSSSIAALLHGNTWRTMCSSCTVQMRVSGGTGFVG